MRDPSRSRATPRGPAAGDHRPDHGQGDRPDDYQFEASGLKAGTNQITFSNGGGELHHVVIARLDDGATIDQANEFFTTEDFKGPPPVDFDASEVTAVLDSGGKEVETVELQSGSYALLCFLTDRAGSPPHVIKAKMIQEVKVPSRCGTVGAQMQLTRRPRATGALLALVLCLALLGPGAAGRAAADADASGSLVAGPAAGPEQGLVRDRPGRSLVSPPGRATIGSGPARRCRASSPWPWPPPGRSVAARPRRPARRPPRRRRRRPRSPVAPARGKLTVPPGGPARPKLEVSPT